MRIYLHINSSCLCALSVNGRYAGRTDPDSFIHLGLDEAGGDILLSAMPVNTGASGEKLLPCSVTAGFSGSILTCGSPCAALTSFPENHYELTLEPERIYSFAPSNAIKQEKFHFNGESHTATLIKDAATRLVCEGAGLIYTYVLPKTFSLKEFSVTTAANGALITAYGAAGGGQDAENEYAAVIAYNGAYSLNLNLLCDKIEFEESNIQTLTSLNDIAKRGIVVTYALDASSGRYEIADSYAVYMYNEVLRPRHEALIPFAFFQAVKAGDFSEARYFMCDALSKEIESDEALAGFLEGFDAMEENKYFPHIQNCAVIRSRHREKNAAKLLVYRLDGDKKIEDIKIL